MSKHHRIFLVALCLSVETLISGCAYKKATSTTLGIDDIAYKLDDSTDVQGSLFASDQAVLSNEDI